MNALLSNSVHPSNARWYKARMSIDVRILLPTDREAILAFEKARLADGPGDEMERELRAWTARWRGEALDHYLGMGWSFGIFNRDRIEAYFLAQPFLFYRGLTQTLWVEHLTPGTPEQAHALLDTAYRWARDKHLQCVLLEDSAATRFALEQYPKAAGRDETVHIEIRSAKF